MVEQGKYSKIKIIEAIPAGNSQVLVVAILGTGDTEELPYTSFTELSFPNITCMERVEIFAKVTYLLSLQENYVR